MNTKIGETLCILRKRNNYTQRQLAKALGVNPATIGHWEQNRNEPSFTMLKKIITLYNISITELFQANSNPKITIAKINQGLVFEKLILFFIEEKLLEPDINSLGDLNPIVNDLLTALINNIINDSIKRIE